MSVRLCRECGRPIEVRRLVFGRTTRADEWFVHLDTDSVPCNPTHRAEYRLNQQQQETT